MDVNEANHPGEQERQRISMEINPKEHFFDQGKKKRLMVIKMINDRYMLDK